MASHPRSFISKDSPNYWVLRWETKHPFYRMETTFTGHRRHHVLGSDYRRMLGISRNGTMMMYHDQRDLDRKSKEGFRILQDDHKIRKFLEDTERLCKRITERSSMLATSALFLSSSQLLRIYRSIYSLHEDLLCSYDLSRPEFYLSIEKHIKRVLQLKGIHTTKLHDAFTLLTTSTEPTLLDQEARDWEAVMASSVTSNASEQEQLLLAHQNKYGWMGTEESDSPWGVDYYKDRLDNAHLAASRQSKEMQRESTRILQSHLLSALDIDHSMICLLKNIQKMAHLRLAIRFTWVRVGFNLNAFFTELSTRIGVSKDDLKKYTHTELVALVQDGKRLNASEVDERQHYCFELYNGRINLFTGEQAKRVEAKYVPKTDHQHIHELKGMSAFNGTATGKVWIINAHTKDFQQAITAMPIGAILVTGMTRPHLMQAMVKSAAIITDEGGVTSHAAIVARELKKPCVIGTKVATKAFQTGDMVFVDATNGLIRRLKPQP